MKMVKRGGRGSEDEASVPISIHVAQDFTRALSRRLVGGG